MNPSDEPQELLEAPEILEENIRPDPRVKWILFAVGFFGWYIFNTKAWFSVMENGPDKQGYYPLFNLVMLPANLLILFILAKIHRTRWAAFGILAAVAVNFLISLILGLGNNAICFIPFLFK